MVTPGVLRWLQHLADHGPDHRARTNVGYRAMVADWTEWDYRVSGEPISVAEAKAKFGDEWLSKIDTARQMAERITPSGLEALATAREQARKDRT